MRALITGYEGHTVEVINHGFIDIASISLAVIDEKHVKLAECRVVKRRDA